MTTKYNTLQLQPSNRNFSLKTHFQFECKRIPATTYFCQFVQIPGMSISALDQKTTFNPVKIPGGNVIYDDLIIQFAVDENYKNWKEIRNWIDECSDRNNFNKIKPYPEQTTSEAVVYLLTSEQMPQNKVTFQGLFPNRLSPIKLDTKAITAEPIYAEVSFSFTSFELELAQSGDITG